MSELNIHQIVMGNLLAGKTVGVWLLSTKANQFVDIVDRDKWIFRLVDNPDNATFFIEEVGLMTVKDKSELALNEYRAKDDHLYLHIQS